MTTDKDRMIRAYQNAKKLGVYLSETGDGFTLKINGEKRQYDSIIGVEQHLEHLLQESVG